MKIDKVAILVKKAALEFDKVSNPYFSEYDLTASQYKIIKFLYAQPTRTARVVDLERQYSMTHPTTLGLLEALEKKGFTTRIENPNDARGKLIALTQKADEMQSELEALGEKIEDKLTERLSANEKGALVILLQMLIGIEG
ncbi:MAG: MarR family transcriptional regulator [Oscillospiraceae bacterium]|nr:MarR family transcriptional regulator [Oscillospiraceae bacterium]